MKTIQHLLFGFLFISVCASCKKDRTVTCSGSASLIPARIGFRGFAPSDIDTLLVHHLTLQNGAVVVTKTDTTIDPGVYSKDSILYSSKHFSVFLWLASGDMLDVELSGIGRTIRLDNAVYTSGTTFYYKSDEEGFCRLRVSPVFPPDRISVDGVAIGRASVAASDFVLTP